MEIVELIEKVRLNIEDNKIITNNVGNRPHYPIYVVFNGSNIKDCSAFINNIQNIWSSYICKNLLFYRYTTDGSKVRFIDVHSDDELDINLVYERTSEAARTRDVFAKRDMWCLYNIIDTANLSFEEFKLAYSSLDYHKEVIDERTRSMVAIILRDDRTKERKSINYQIRNFLREETIYDSVVIVSNRARGGFEYESDEVFRVVSNLILLSNNDAVTTADDEYFAERCMKLYSRTPLIISYNSLSKPTKDILSCMVQRLIIEVCSLINESNTKTLSSKDIDSILGIENGKIVVFYDFIHSINQRIIQEVNCSEILQYMPMSSPSVITSKDLESKSFSQLDGINVEILNLIAMEYCRQFMEGEEGKVLLQKYSKNINDNLNLMNIGSVSENKIVETFEELIGRSNKPNILENPKTYFSQLIIYTLKTRFIFPYCIELAKKICNANIIEKTKENIETFKNKVDEQLPVSGFDEISTFYGKNMSNFLNTDIGKERVYQILKVGNTYDDICTIVEQTLCDANEYCDEIISMPFISVWANALKIHDGEVFQRIRNTLYGDGDDAILLRGLYPVIEELSIYMLHCYDRNGDNETELFSQFKEAYKHVSNVQFFNTGNDDSIESIKFYKCAGTSLILLGLNDIVS